MIAACFFDMGETLAIARFNKRAFYNLLFNFLHKRGYRVRRYKLLHSIRRAKEYVYDVRRRQEEISLYAFVDILLNDLGIIPDAHILDSIRELYLSCYSMKLLSGAKLVLQYLKQKRNLKLAIVSNSMSGWPKRLLKKAKIDHLFDLILISGEVGVRKPSPLIFRIAMNLLDLLPEEILFIGDSLTEDVRGAINVGMRVIWIAKNRKSGACYNYPTKIVTRVYKASNILEIPTLIEKIELCIV